jgi:hypothetical protein
VAVAVVGVDMMMGETLKTFQGLIQKAQVTITKNKIEI